MDEDQQFGFNLSVSGHNVVITGQAGTGKTFLVAKIAKYLRYQQKKSVAIVCSTGIAATHYGDLGAQTLHKWSGINDGRYLNEEIIHLVKTDEKFSQAKLNIETVETLIIDEVSMISSKILSQVELLCKHIRNSTELFGNVQVILVGDFFQLPPISNELYGDPGNQCFKLTWFEHMFPHKINLHIVHRQDELNLIKCVNELEIGNPSEVTVAFLNSLDRPLENEESSVHLFARNLDVDVFNYKKLQQIPGDMTVYNSTDEGSSYYLNKLMAPKNLGLKLKCRVMLIKNLSDVLVNGMCGEVTKLCEKSVDVTFKHPDKSVTINIVPVSFTKYDPVTKTDLAKRVQLPLKLAYAFTIHKSQGMSLPNLIVNCQHIIQPGQLGVAIGRAVSIKGLKVVNFKKHLCQKHPKCVSMFYESFTVGEVKSDLSCCRHKDNANKDTGLEPDSDNDKPSDTDDLIANDSDFSDIEIEILEHLENHPFTNESSVSKKALDSVILQFIDTPVQQEATVFQTTVCKKFKPYDDWFEEQFSVIEGIGLRSFPEEKEKFTQKHRNDFFVKFNQYINSSQYTASALNLLSIYNQDHKGPVFRVLTSLLFYLEQHYLENLSCHIQLLPPAPLTKPSAELDIDSVGRGKIRYVSGYVVAKLKYNLSKKIRNSLFVKGKEMFLDLNQNKMEILNSLCCSYDELLMSSTDLESLEEIHRKQNQREGLTNITDEAFSFFQSLELQCRQKLTHENLVNVGKTLFHDVKEELLCDSDLYQSWLQCVVKSRKCTESESNIDELLSTLVTACENYIDLFNSVVELFLKVSLSQFRRDYLAFLKKEKGKSLRKKVMEKSKKAVKSFSMKFYQEDGSVNKEVSYLRLKSELLQNSTFLEENSFSVKDLLMLCNDFHVKTSGKNKCDIINVLVKGILEMDSNRPQPDIPDNKEPQPGPSGNTTATSHSDPVPSAQPASKKNTSSIKRSVKRKGKGKGKSKGKKAKTSEDTDEKCTVCYKSYVSGEQWISCDLCSLWYHRNCVHLQNEDEWLKYSEEDEPFSCPMCM